MNQQPDKLFREKLHAYQPAVPAGAWSKVEARLDKKNAKGIWLKIAASLLVLALAGVWLINKSVSDDRVAENKQKAESKKQKADQVQPNVTANDQEKGRSNDVSAAPRDSQPVKTNRKKVVKPAQKVIESNSVAANGVNVVKVEEKQPEIELPSIHDNVQETVVAQTTVEETPVQKMTIVFSADEVNNKYLDKKSLADATSDNKKPSTLKKLIDKAYDLKNNQEPFGDLRQMKNEILALNFRTEKQRSKN